MLRFRRTSRLFLCLYIASLFLPALYVAAEPAQQDNASVFLDDEEAPTEEVTFSFLQGFPEAQAEKIKKGKVSRAQWDGTGFRFGDSEPNVIDFFIHDQTLVSGKTRPAIWILVAPGYESSLTFSKIPSGRKLNLFYALPDYVFQEAGKVTPSFVQMEIFIGKKRIYEGQTNTKGWKEKTLDLSLPYLLQRDLQVTIRVRSLDPQPRYFVLYGNIE